MSEAAVNECRSWRVEGNEVAICEVLDASIFPVICLCKAAGKADLDV